MVRAGVVQHPGEWVYGGYREIQNPKQRYTLIDRQKLADLLGIKDHDQLTEYHRKWVEETLKNGTNQRDGKWTQSIAVGDKEFVMETKAKLGAKAIGRRGVKNVEGYELKERQSPYNRVFDPIFLRVQTLATPGGNQSRYPGPGSQFFGTGKNNAGGLIMDDDRQNIIIYNTADGKASVSLYTKDGMVWMNQNQLAKLFDTSVPNISMHISNILKDKELDEKSVVKDYLTTAADGKDYHVTFYSLEMVLAIGFGVRSKRGTQFRIWANRHLKEYMVKGFVMDDERLKNPDGRPDYFDELLERIREIRASEKRFYQKVRDLFALSSDYDKTDKATQMFFAETQNKLLYAVTKQTATEITLERADADKPNMALTSWKGHVVRKQDIFIAKIYLSEDEIDTLNRLVVIFLETAELRAKNRIDITMKFWHDNVDRILAFNEQPLLKGKGKISNAAMEEKVREIYRLFDKKRKIHEAEQADQEDLAELKLLEEKIEKSK